MKYFDKKLVVLFFLSLIVFSTVPKAVFAIPVVIVEQPVLTAETNPKLTIIQTLTQKLTSASTLGSKIQQLFEWAFKIAAESLKRQLLNMIVDQIVKWIQGGGEPKFITDFPGFLQEAVDKAGGEFLKELGLGLFCSPYNLSLKAAFIPIPKFSDRSACTLSKVGVNIDNFLKNFNSGGWVAWNEMVLRPQNNIYGAYLMALDEYERVKSAAEKSKTAEAQAGKGFLSVKRCAPGFSRQQQLFDEDGEPAGTETICDKQEIVTPGHVVGELAGKAIGSDIDYIVNAKDFAAYVSAITNAALNRMFAEGVGLLRMAISSSSGTSGSAGAGTAQNNCEPFLGKPAYTQCVNSIQSGQDIREFQKTSLIKDIGLDLVYQNQLLGAKQTTLIILNQSLDILRQFETCQGSLSLNTAAVQSDINTFTSQIFAIQSDITALQLKQQQISTVTDITEIPSLYAQVAGLVNPSITQTLALAAQEETAQKQTASLSYQQQLDSCNQERIRQQPQQQP